MVNHSTSPERIDNGYGENGCGCGCQGRDHVRTFYRVVRGIHEVADPKPTWESGDLKSRLYVIGYGYVKVPEAYRVDSGGTRRVRALATLSEDGTWRKLWWEIER